MPNPPAPLPWIDRVRPWRRLVEIGFWVTVLSVQLLFNSLTHWMDLRSAGRPVPFGYPLVLELTSNLAIGLLIPAVIAFERRFPLRWDTLGPHLPWHMAATLVFCAVHVVLMMSARQGLFGLLGTSYGPPDWLRAFGYEYLKDVRTYALILAAVFGWRLLLLRLQGEARVLDAPEPAVDAPAQAAPLAMPRPERFLVRKLHKEFLIAATDIDWVQAQANYVGLHVHGHDYLLRSTLTDFLQQLDPARFVRVHRGYAVNLDRVVEIEPLDGGDARLRMKNGSTVPCSRRYRAALGAAAP